MSEALTVIAVLFVSLAITVAVFAIFVLVLRWVFRIDEIFDILRAIEHHLRPPEPPQAPQQPVSPPDRTPLLATCDACKRYFKADSLVKIAIGKTVCPACKKFIESKKS